MDEENKFKIGDYVKERSAFFDPSIRDSRRGQVYDIQTTAAKSPSVGFDYHQIFIKSNNGETYSDFFYVFELDKEKIRSEKINSIINE